MARCPYCDQPVHMTPMRDGAGSEVRREVKGWVKKEVLYSCPHCDRVLGFGYYPGGWSTGRP